MVLLIMYYVYYIGEGFQSNNSANVAVSSWFSLEKITAKHEQGFINSLNKNKFIIADINPMHLRSSEFSLQSRTCTNSNVDVAKRRLWANESLLNPNFSELFVFMNN